MAVKSSAVYIKADMHTIVFDRNVTINDVLKIEGTDEGMVRQIKQMKIFTFPDPSTLKKKKNQTEVFSILKLIEKIHEKYPDAEVQNCGEQDFIVEYVGGVPKPKWLEITKLVLLCVLVFFGAAFTIMAFNNDIDVNGVFARLYAQFVGGQKPAVTELEVCYSIGIAVGILVFFNHVGKKKITPDPTPIQVEMRKYEKDMDLTMIENASRKGHNQDVS